MPKITYETWVTSFVERLVEHFNLFGWNITVEFSGEEDTSGATYANNVINSSYQFSTLTFYPKAEQDYNNRNIDALKMAIVHELVHIFLDPLHEYMHPHLSLTTTPLFMGTLEQQTQKLTMVLLKTLPDSITPPLPPRKPNGKHSHSSKNGMPKPAVHPAIPLDVHHPIVSGD